MSNKYVFGLCVLGFTALQAAPAFAQSAAPVVTRPPVERNATPALWVLKDEDTTIYLFGTFHAMPAGLNWNFGAVKSAFESADLLKLEIDSLNGDNADVPKIVAEKGRQPAGVSLYDGLNARQTTAFNRIIAEARIPRTAMEPLRPWLASIYLSTNLISRMGMDPNKGVDKILDGQARARNIPVQGFETAAEQIGFMASLSDANQQAMLVSTLDEWDTYETQLNQLTDAWATGNERKIDRMLSGSLRKQPDLARVLLTDRNRRWAEWIGARMAAPGTVFVAVGAGHLAGRDSVQAFLRAKGLRTTRVDTRMPR